MIIFSSIKIPINIINVNKNNFVDAEMSYLSSYRPSKNKNVTKKKIANNSLLLEIYIFKKSK